MEDLSRRRRSNWREAEVMALCQFVGMHKSALFGKAGHASVPVEKRKKRYWKKAAVHLRAVGFFREEEEVRRKWGDLKQRALKYKSARNATGGGSLEIKPLMEAVLEVLAKETVVGVMGQETEAGFSSSQSTNESGTDTASNLLKQLLEGAASSPVLPTISTPVQPPTPIIPDRPASLPPTSDPPATHPTASRPPATCLSEFPVPTPHPPTVHPPASQQLVELERERLIILRQQNSHLERIANSLDVIAAAMSAPNLC
ncbi:uncharacterized protein [Diadema setosum]|uniref:uncharacterized protein n=1 Tax=Diadema setosum TaxID=31175 RepID=UPI003B3B9CE7